MELHEIGTGRRVWHQPSTEDVYFEEPDESEPICEHEDLWAAIEHLTARQAFVVRLHYGLADGEVYTQQEIADMASWSLATVQEHLFRAEQKIYKLLTGKVRKNPL